MHTLPVLQKFLFDSLPGVHAYRLRAVSLAVDGVVHGARVGITAMGRSLGSGTRTKHRVKRMDRLVGNGRLAAQHERFYRAMSRQLLAGCERPLILIDWSDFSDNRQQQLLRASVPVGGRAMTLLEELHPYDKLANRAVQHRFLDRLAGFLPSNCTPIIVADAGFRVPFFRYVESLGWHWLGRIRNRDCVLWEGAPYEWVSAKSLYPLAKVRPQDLGPAQWVRHAPLTGRLVVVRQRKAGRQHRALSGRRRQSHHSRTNAKRAREPWLLIASSSLRPYSARQLVNCYKTRMQIEENFRDTKSVAYGLGVARGRYTSYTRAGNLLLIAALAQFALWLIGCWAKRCGALHLVRVNSSSRSADYSNLFLARLIIHQAQRRLPRDCLNHAPTHVHRHLQAVLNP